MPENNEISLPSLKEGLAVLSQLSLGEYHKHIDDILANSNEELAFKQTGRLMCVWIKQPFAIPFEYDPTLPWNWAKSYRAWEIHDPVSQELMRHNLSRYELLMKFAEEWDRPVQYLAEYNLFLSICKRIRPIICSESKMLEQVEKVGKDLQKTGQGVSFFSINNLLGVTSVSVATQLVQNVEFLSASYLPIVTGITLLLSCYGQNKLCNFLKGFEESYDPKKDRFAGSNRCNSTATNNGAPCMNPVKESGKPCWIHKPART
jgi:hypothetical protein